MTLRRSPCAVERLVPLRIYNRQGPMNSPNPTKIIDLVGIVLVVAYMLLLASDE